MRSDNYNSPPSIECSMINSVDFNDLGVRTHSKCSGWLYHISCATWKVMWQENYLDKPFESPVLGCNGFPSAPIAFSILNVASKVDMKMNTLPDARYRPGQTRRPNPNGP